MAVWLHCCIYFVAPYFVAPFAPHCIQQKTGGLLYQFTSLLKKLGGLISEISPPSFCRKNRPPLQSHISSPLPPPPSILIIYVLAIFGSEKDRIRDRTTSDSIRFGFDSFQIWVVQSKIKIWGLVWIRLGFGSDSF